MNTKPTPRLCTPNSNRRRTDYAPDPATRPTERDASNHLRHGSGAHNRNDLKVLDVKVGTTIKSGTDCRSAPSTMVHEDIDRFWHGITPRANATRFNFLISSQDEGWACNCLNCTSSFGCQQYCTKTKS
jgi:hypothetical protein